MRRPYHRTMEWTLIAPDRTFEKSYNLTDCNGENKQTKIN
jgi:hypothetical protein